MDRNNETIRLAKKAADAWRTTDTYHQAAQIIDMLISALEGDPTLTPPNEPLTGWVSVEERLPELQGKDRCSKMVIACDKNGHVAPMIWERAQIRGKKIERWKYYWDRIYDGAGITHWRPLPAPPYRRPPEGEEET